MYFELNIQDGTCNLISRKGTAGLGAIKLPCLCNNAFCLTALVLVKVTLAEAINEGLLYVFSIDFNVFYK